jgi:hypothetical protein
VVEVKLDPNLPLDYFMQTNDQMNVRAEDLDSSYKSMPPSKTGELVFILRKKTPPKFNVCFDVLLIDKAKKQRYILVDSATTVKEVLDIIFSVEGLEEGDRLKYGLFREPCEVNPKRKAKFFDLDEHPFDITDTATKYSFRDMVRTDQLSH